MVSSKRHLFCVDALKAFAIIGILLNHFVESFGSFPWFSNPSYNWPDVATRLSSIFPAGESPGWRLIQFLGWLGDMGPGIFILVSGFTLTFSVLNKNEKEINIREFYIKRLVRIFPLYLVIHLLIILFGVVLDAGMGFDSSKVSLSMLGLRFKDSLFFYINPSWWFIWLILQLYLIYPLLYRLLLKKGIKTFLIITIGFTILSRLAGLLNFTFSDHLEYWMTGIFAGTRLSEFTAGMVLARLIYENRFDPVKISLPALLSVSLVLYLLGFLSSLFYVTTLISSLLITIGLSGIMLFLGRIVQSNLPSLINAFKWTGAVSFSVFLLHQPLMIWVGNSFSGTGKVLAELSVLILVFPAGWLIDKSVNRSLSVIPRISRKITLSIIFLFLSVQLLLNVFYFVTGKDLVYRVDVILFLINIFFIPLYLFFSSIRINRLFKAVIYYFITTSVIFAAILTKNWFSLFFIFIIAIIIVHLILSVFRLKETPQLVISFLSACLLFFISEIWLAKNQPVEVNTWGELPALQRDPETIYSLIPDKETHLRYNNYDYKVRTNSLGFNGPEVIINRKDDNEIRILIIGDAFTMPEGMEYEKAYPELLQANLQRSFPEKKITIFNGGVTGYGPNEMYAALLKYLDILKPDIFINQIFINEFEEINLNEKERLNSIGLIDRTIRERLFSGNQLPQQVRTGFHKLLKDESFRRNTFNKSLIQFYGLNTGYYLDENISRLRDYFNKVSELCEKHKCSFSVLYAPGQIEISSPDMISYYPAHLDLNDTLRYDFLLPVKAFEEICRSTDIPFFNPADTLRSNPVQPVYFRDSWHWNEEGHKVVAGFLADEIIKAIVK